MSPRTIYPLSLTDTAFIAIDYTTDKGTLVGYSVALVTWFEGRWRTVRVYDNAHAATRCIGIHLAQGNSRARSSTTARRERPSTMPAGLSVSTTRR